MENKEQKEEQQPKPPTPPSLRKSKLAGIGEKQQSAVNSSCLNASYATYTVSPRPSTTNASCTTYTVSDANNSTNSTSITSNGGDYSKASNHKSSSSSKTINKSANSKSNKSAKSSSQSHSCSAATTGSGGGGGTGSSKNSTPSGDSKADTEEDEDDQHQGGGTGSGSLCECVQCEVCMAENWWRMAALQNSLLQQQEGSSPGFEISESAATGLDLIGSAASLMLNQQRASTANGGGNVPTEDMFRADFSMPKLLEFFECQKSMGIPNFPEDFDEFWLLVVKARLFNIFKYRGPEAYNRVVHKIRNIVRQFRDELEVRERQEAAAAAMTAIISGKEPKEAIGIAEELVSAKKAAEEKIVTNKMAAGNGNNKTKKQQSQKKGSS